MFVPDALRFGPILMLAIVAAGCPTREVGDSLDDPDSPYPLGDSLGWAAIPDSADLATERISTWLDRPNALAEPVAGAGDCSLVRTKYDPADGPASHRNTVSYEHRGYMLW